MDIPKPITALLFILMIVISCAAEASVSSGPFVQIINKSKLPADRLAEAIAAKGILTFDSKLLRQAALMVQNDPALWYWAAKAECSRANYEPTRLYHILLERSLKADPKYLPALYAYAISKPTSKQRMEALQSIAQLDADNSAPYYLTAMELYKSYCDRPCADYDTGSMVMSESEWASILDLVKKGNERKHILTTLPRVPSTRDIKVKEGNRYLSPRVVAECLSSFSGLLESVAVPVTSMSFTINAYARQLCRQGLYEAKKARLAGKIDAARETNTVMLSFAKKYAASEPHRQMSLLTGLAMWKIAEVETANLYRQTDDKARLAALQKEFVTWNRHFKHVLGLSFARTGAPKVSIAVEEANVRKILSELGLTGASAAKPAVSR